MCGNFKIKESSFNEKHARLLLEFIRANPDKDFFDLLREYLKHEPQAPTIENDDVTTKVS